MKTKLILLSSAATLFTSAAAFAADPIIAPEPEAVEYVRVCDAYGAGYFYIPGTETCLRIHGYVRYDITGGDDVYGHGFEARDSKLFAKSNKRDTYEGMARFSLKFSTASETELGTLKTYADLRFQWKDGKDDKSSGTLRFGYMELGGLRVGLDESAFVTFPGYLGNVINDDVILAGGYRTGLISYTYAGDNGLSAILSVEQAVTVTLMTCHLTGPVKNGVPPSRTTRRMSLAACATHKAGVRSPQLPPMMPAIKNGQGKSVAISMLPTSSPYGRWVAINPTRIIISMS